MSDWCKYLKEDVIKICDKFHVEHFDTLSTEIIKIIKQEKENREVNDE